MSKQQSLYRNSEGYFSPTEGAALSRIIREERKKRRIANNSKGCTISREMTKTATSNHAARRREHWKHVQYTLAWVNPNPYPIPRHNQQERHKNRRCADENTADQTAQG